MKLTLDGLIRALRMKAHQLADEIESGYARQAGREEADGEAGPETRMRDDGVGGN